MSETTSTLALRKVAGIAVAILIGVGTVALVNASAIFSKDSAVLSGEWGIFLVQSLMVALPFAILAFLPNVGRIAWSSALVLTALFWCLPVLDQLFRSGGGANIGLGLLMLVSPLVVLAGAISTEAAFERRQNR